MPFSFCNHHLLTKQSAAGTADPRNVLGRAATFLLFQPPVAINPSRPEHVSHRQKLLKMAGPTSTFKAPSEIAGLDRG